MEEIEEKKNIGVEEAIEGMKSSKADFCVRGGRFFHHASDEYIKRLQFYAQYCVENQVDFWESDIEKLVGAAGNVNNEYLAYVLHTYEDIARIMKLLNCTDCNFSEVKDLLAQSDNRYFIIKKLLQFSPYAGDLINRCMGDTRFHFLTSFEADIEQAKIRNKQLIISKSDSDINK